MLLEHERNCGLGMDALVVAFMKNERNCGLDMDVLSHPSKHERNYGLGMDALVIALALTQEATSLFKKARPR